MHNIVNNLTLTQSLAPQTIQGSALSSGNIDMQGAEALCILVLVGALADTLSSTVRLDLKIEHAEDNGSGSPDTYTACTDADVLNFTGLSSGIFKSLQAAGDKSKRYAISYIGSKRFVKVTATPVSLTTGGPVAMLTIKGNPAQRPVTNA